MLWLLKLIDPISAITREIGNTRVKLAQEQNTERRIKLEGEVAALNAQQSVLIATQQFFLNRLMRFLIAFPVAFVLWKLFIWDKALGLGSTDALGQDLWDILKIVVGGYFLTNVVDRWRK